MTMVFKAIEFIEFIYKERTEYSNLLHSQNVPDNEICELVNRYYPKVNNLNRSGWYTYVPRTKYYQWSKNKPK